MPLSEKIKILLVEYGSTIEDQDYKNYIQNAAESLSVIQTLNNGFWSYYISNSEPMELPDWIISKMECTWERMSKHDRQYTAKRHTASI